MDKIKINFDKGVCSGRGVVACSFLIQDMVESICAYRYERLDVLNAPLMELQKPWARVQATWEIKGLKEGLGRGSRGWEQKNIPCGERIGKHEDVEEKDKDRKNISCREKMGEERTKARS